ncbi:MAG: hypothetical protein ACOYMI_08750 [Phycisphaerales bacterium]
MAAGGEVEEQEAIDGALRIRGPHGHREGTLLRLILKPARSRFNLPD